MPKVILIHEAKLLVYYCIETEHGMPTVTYYCLKLKCGYNTVTYCYYRTNLLLTTKQCELTHDYSTISIVAVASYCLKYLVYFHS